MDTLKVLNCFIYENNLVVERNSRHGIRSGIKDSFMHKSHFVYFNCNEYLKFFKINLNCNVSTYCILIIVFMKVLTGYLIINNNFMI
jgi:hypothetical protein